MASRNDDPRPCDTAGLFEALDAEVAPCLPTGDVEQRPVAGEVEPSQPGPLGGGFLASVGKLVAGVLCAQGLSLLLAPLVTRLYTPAVFGQMSLFMAIAAVVAVVCTGRYHMAIVLPRSDAQAANLLVLSLGILALVTAAVAVGVLLAGGLLCDLMGAGSARALLWILPVSVAARGLFVTLQYWAVRRKGFGPLARAQVCETVLGSTGILAAGFSGWATAAAMVLSRAAGLLGASAMLLRKSLRGDLALLKRIRWSRLVGAARRYRKFPLVSSWAILLNAAAFSVPLMVMAAFFSPEVVGLFALAERIITVPLGLLGGAVSQVFYQRLSSARRQGRPVAGLVEVLSQRLLTLGLFPAMLIAAAGGPVFSVVFGPAWTQAGLIVQVLAGYGLMRFVAAPLVGLCNVMGRQEVELKFNAVLLAARLASIAAGALAGDLWLAVVAFGVVVPLAYAALLLWVMRLSGARLRVLALRAGVHLAWMIPLAGCVASLRLWAPAAVVLAAATASMIVAAGMLAATDRRLRGRLKSVLRRAIVRISARRGVSKGSEAATFAARRPGPDPAFEDDYGRPEGLSWAGCRRLLADLVAQPGESGRRGGRAA